MIKYIAHLMDITDTLRIPGENTIGLPVNGKTEIVTFVDGKAEVPGDVAMVIKDILGNRMFIKEEFIEDKVEEIEEKPIQEEKPVIKEKPKLVDKSKPTEIKKASIKPKRRTYKKSKK